MTVHSSASWPLRVAAGVAVVFGLLTIVSGGRALFSGPAPAAAVGDAVPFVLPGHSGCRPILGGVNLLACKVLDARYVWNK